jgi:hypothetical protein
LLAVVAVAVLAAARYVQTRQHATDELHDAMISFGQATHGLVVSTLDLRAAQQAYVAAGQGDTYWASKVSAGIQALGDAIRRVRQQTENPEAQAALDTAAEQVPKLREIDKRALDYMKSDQRLMASDLIFTDGLEATRVVIDQAEAARTAEFAAALQTVERLKWGQMIAGVAAVLLGLLIALVFAMSQGEPDMTEAMALAQPSRAQEAEQLSGLARANAANAVSLSDASTADGKETDGQLAAAAELCTEFARVIDPGELPALLQRSARLLEAKGLIVWITDPTGGTLRPALAHGYSSQALAMMGTLPRDGDNATSLAYREARIETVPSEGGGMAALVVPLMSSAGCAGAVAVEMPAGLETRPDTQALAVIVAAQLGALVALPQQEPVRSKA